jgi:hypothetical protein
VGAGEVAVAIMDELRACLCTALEASLGGAPCFCGMYPGSLTVADWCGCTTDRRGQTSGCGMAATRLDRVYAWDGQVTTPARTPRCDAPLAAVIELAVYRCQPTQDANGNPPDAVAQANAALIQLGDLSAMLTALNCCEALTERNHVLGTYLPRDGGGCGGGVWPVTVALIRR